MDIDKVRQVAEDSVNAAEMLERLGLGTGTTEYRHLRKVCADNNITIPTGRRRAQGKYSDEEVFCENSRVQRSVARNRIIRNNLIPLECATPECGLSHTWLDKPLNLVLDHINGVPNDHRLENLRFLCPNCNSQQETFCGRNNRRCIDCNVVVSQGSVRCRACWKISGTIIPPKKRASKPRPFQPRPDAERVEWPDNTALLAMVKTYGFRGAANRIGGISDNAVRKRLQRRGLI
jgi:hypothetical protein